MIFWKADFLIFSVLVLIRFFWGENSGIIFMKFLVQGPLLDES